MDLLAAALDQPGQAKAYLPAAADAALAESVKLTTAEPGTLGEKQVRQLGDWYKSVAARTEKSAPSVAASLLQRAAGAYRRFLALHTAADLQQALATTAVSDIEKQLERIGRPAEQTTFLLSRIIPKQHQVYGRWEMTPEGVLIGDASSGNRVASLVVPVMPQGNYELSIAFQSDTSNDIGFTLPVGPSAVSVRWVGQEVGLVSVNGSDVWYAQGKLPMPSADRNVHVLYAKVLIPWAAARPATEHSLNKLRHFQ